MIRQLWRTGLAAAAAIALGLGTSAEAQAQTSSGCSTTWTTACASVTVFTGSGENLVVSATNTSSGDEANALHDWFQVAVDPDATLAGTTVWGNCDDGFDPTTMELNSDNCDDISKNWSLKSNNQGSIAWEGTATDQGNSGLVSGMEYCNNSDGLCWEGPVYFEMNFDETVSFEQWAMHAKRLGEDDEYSDWIGEVPEPMTTTLVGIGLAAGAAVRRRRKNGELDEDEEEPGLA